MADNTNVFDPTVYPDLSHIHDRRPLRPDIERVYFPEESLSQGADINEAFSIEAERRTAIGNLIAKDGDRLSGADAIVDAGAATVTMAQGELYLLGAGRLIPARVLTAVPMVGDVKIGVRMVEIPVTAEDDALFLGLDPIAEESYGEPGAVRMKRTFTWAFDSDGASGTFFPYITVRNGDIVSQDGPPTLSGVTQQIAVYDYDSHENYIVRGCQVSPLGKIGANQVFSIAEGTANILGFKIQRPVSTRYAKPEDPSLGTVDAEPHNFDDGGTGTYQIPVRRTPISAVESVIVTKQKTVTLTKGVTGSVDALPDDGVSTILSVVQGATTYAPGTSYIQNGDAVDWTAGAQPATGSSYQVTYRYLDAVTPTAVTPTSITVQGGVTGQPLFARYTYKLPRVDRICLDEFGNVVYLTGISAPSQPQPPQVPKTVLKLATVHNDWFGTPTIENDGDLAVPVSLQRKMIDKMYDLLNEVTLTRQKLDINVRSAGAANAMFSDPLTSDFYRDAGEVQNGAVFNGTFQIAIVPTFVEVTATTTLFLNYSEETVISQDLVSGCEKINPYQAFAPLPLSMSITPAQDFWTEQQTIWLSQQTQVFGSGNQERVIDTDIIQTVTSSAIRFLRQIPINFSISGMGSGELITTLTFDSINVNPGGLIANAQGVVTGSFVIPANVTSGSKQIVAVGAAGRTAAAVFTGEGRIETLTLQAVTTIERFQQTVASRNNFGGADSSDHAGNSPDPQAQSFVFTEGRHISSIDLRFCNIGDRNQPVIVEVVTVENGFPTTRKVAQTEIDMQTVVANQWTKFDFDVPFYLPAGTMFAFVVKTNDPDHSISVAERGQFDASKQQFIAGQPYTVGTRFSSSNAVSWTIHQDSDITFRINCAVFSPVSRTIALGSYLVENCSDVLIRGDIFLPTSETKIVFELDFPGEPTVRILPDQVWERTSFFTGSVVIRAVLTGSAKVSPVVERDILAIFGTMQANGVYITRAFDMGTDVDVDFVGSTKLPVGSTLTVEVDKGDDAWQTMAQVLATPIDLGFIERTYRRTDFDAPLGGRIKLTLTGTPAARPSVMDARAWTF